MNAITYKEIFELITHYKLKVNLIQVSALSLSLCLEDKYNKINYLVNKLNVKYSVEQTDEVKLFTSRHFTQQSQEEFTKDKNVLLEQLTKDTM